MECKFRKQFFDFLKTGELIETLWNVNNRGIHQDSGATGGINRNIVECKYTHNLYDNLHYLELIETLWNVNFCNYILYNPLPSELIETLWNVNYL